MNVAIDILEGKHVMTINQLLIVVILLAAMGLLVWGKWRYDLLALFSCTLLGLIPTAQAFSGFGHLATITVAIVLILSYGISSAGNLYIV